MQRRILESAGGKDNIQNFEHCATRLRIIVKDDTVVDVAKVDALKEDIGGYFFQSGQRSIYYWNRESQLCL
ncbi:PTS transporter subunit EIIB [Erysipelothrix sp. D19-032]